MPDNERAGETSIKRGQVGWRSAAEVSSKQSAFAHAHANLVAQEPGSPSSTRTPPSWGC